LLSLPNAAVVPLLLVSDKVSKLILFAVIELLARFMPEDVVEQSFAVSELLVCLLLLPNNSVITLTEALALRCAITEQLALSSTVTKLFALLLLTVAKQSFAVSKLRACLLLPKYAVVVLLSLPDTVSKLICFAVIGLLA